MTEPTPAGEDIPRVALLSRAGSPPYVEAAPGGHGGYEGWRWEPVRDSDGTWVSPDVISPAGQRWAFEQHESRAGSGGWHLMVGALSPYPGQD